METATETLVGTANDDVFDPPHTDDVGIDSLSAESTSDSASSEIDTVIEEALQRPWAMPDEFTKAMPASVPIEPRADVSDSTVEELPVMSAAPSDWRRTKWLGIPSGPALVAAFSAVATVICMLSLLVLLHDPIIELLPAATSFYRLLGLNPDPLGAGLEIRNIESVREHNEGGDVLIVTGEVANVVSAPASLPTIRVSLYDAYDNELRSVTLVNTRGTLSAGEALSFNARITDLRPKAKHVRVGFIPLRQIARP